MSIRAWIWWLAQPLGIGVLWYRHWYGLAIFLAALYGFEAGVALMVATARIYRQMKSSETEM